MLLISKLLKFKLMFLFFLSYCYSSDSHEKYNKDFYYYKSLSYTLYNNTKNEKSSILDRIKESVKNNIDQINCLLNSITELRKQLNYKYKFKQQRIIQIANYIVNGFIENNLTNEISQLITLFQFKMRQEEEIKNLTELCGELQEQKEKRIYMNQIFMNQPCMNKKSMNKKSMNNAN